MKDDAPLDLARGWWIPANLRVAGDLLSYDVSAKNARRLEIPPLKLLQKFIRLTDHPEEIEEYARHFGVLALCREHGFPYGHPALKGSQRVCQIASTEDEKRHLESIERWREWSRIVRALLNIAAQVRGRQRIDDEAWRTVFPGRKTPEWIEQQRRDRGDAWILEYALNNFIATFGQLRPMVVLEQDQTFVVRIGGPFPINGLPAALTLECLSLTVGASRLAVCSVCGDLYRMKRKPAEGQRHYCPKCGIRAAWTIASKKRSQDRSAAFRLADQGKEVAAIAQQLNKKEATVRRWLKGRR